MSSKYQIILVPTRFREKGFPSVNFLLWDSPFFGFFLALHYADVSVFSERSSLNSGTSTSVPMINKVVDTI